MSYFSDLEEHPDWDYLDITDSEFGPSTIDGSTVRVPVHQLVVGAGFPRYEQSQLYNQCTLVFSGVVSSTRQVYEYTDSTHRDFKPGYTVDDGPFPKSQARGFRFTLAGWSYDPSASIRWIIIAKGVHIEDGIK